MILPVESDGFEDYLQSVHTLVDDTVFDFIPELYKDHYDLIEHIFNHRDEWTCDSYIGDKKDIIISGLEYENNGLFDMRGFWSYVTDYIQRLRNRISEDFSTDYDYIRSLSNFYSSISPVSSELLYNRLVRRYEQMRSETGLEEDLIIPSKLKSLEMKIVTGSLLS